MFREEQLFVLQRDEVVSNAKLKFAKMDTCPINTTGHRGLNVKYVMMVHGHTSIWFLKKYYSHNTKVPKSVVY